MYLTSSPQSARAGLRSGAAGLDTHLPCPGLQEPAEEQNLPQWEVHPKWSTAMVGVPHQPCLRTQQVLNQLTGLLEACEHLSLNFPSTASTTGEEWIKL